MLPTGTVTFLFTDIEGSTKLWQQFPDAMPAALARHHEILRRAIESHNGYVFQIIGDAFCAAFATAPDGLDAALDAQRALRDFDWGETGAIRVRMALHTGAVELRAGEFTSGEYVSGITLSRAARLLSAGHGGQILLSAPTAELLREQLPQNIALRDMGAHRLKDLVQPQQIFQILAPDLSQEFPALKTLDALPNNLPIQLTSFVGREREIGETKDIVRRARLVTLTGAGGSGKTRLSLQVAAEVVDEFEKGAWFVDLAPLTDASLVPNAVMNALELREETGRAPLDALTDFLRAKKLLLILDNCEHLVEPCAQLAHHLLTHCPNLKILATSREGLGVAGEVTYQVPVLALPDPKHLPSLDALSQYDAVKLFVERAIFVQPNFSVTNANAPAVAQICYRLDGIPLAIELAAARIKLFSPEQIAARLDDRLRLLTGGSRTAMPRQQTLRAAIEWSYSLLSEPERVLFRRLAVFAGGWTFEAAEHVCAGDGLNKLDILESLAQLVNKSLVTTETRGDATRYRMLETIREFAIEKFRDTGEMDAIRTRHLEFFVGFAEFAEPKLRGPEQSEWLEILDIEHDNLRAAFGWSNGSGRVENGLRLTSALMLFWEMRAYFSEGRQLTESLLNQPEGVQKTLLRASALLCAGKMAGDLGDEEKSLEYFQELIVIARNEGKGGLRVLSYSLGEIGLSMFDKDPTAAKAMVEEGVAIARALNDEWLIGWLLFKRGTLFWAKGDNSSARKDYEESEARFKLLGDTLREARASSFISGTEYEMGEYVQSRHREEQNLSFFRRTKNRQYVRDTLNSLGEIARAENRYDLAREYYRESLEIARELGNKSWTQFVCANLGYVALHDGDLASARALFTETLTWARESHSIRTIGSILLGFASIAAADKHAHRAIRLFSAKAALFSARDWQAAGPADEQEDERYLALAREQLDEATFNAAWEEGRALTMEQAIELALSKT